MTTEILIDIKEAPRRQQGTRDQSEQEELFNYYWAEYYRRLEQGFDLTCLPASSEFFSQQAQNTLAYEEESIAKILQPAIAKPKISQKNLEARRILNQWFAEPDDLGEEFWNEFCEDLEKNRFAI